MTAFAVRFHRAEPMWARLLTGKRELESYEMVEAYNYDTLGQILRIMARDGIEYDVPSCQLGPEYFRGIHALRSLGFGRSRIDVLDADGNRLQPVRDEIETLRVNERRKS